MLCSAVWDIAGGQQLTRTAEMQGTRAQAWASFPATVATWESEMNLTSDQRVSMTVTAA